MLAATRGSGDRAGATVSRSAGAAALAGDPDRPLDDVRESA